MTFLLTIAGAVSIMYDTDDDLQLDTLQDDVTTTTKSQSMKNRHQLNIDFLAFRRTYMLVYLVIMLADWMQGTHMYTLYLSYGVNISALFLTGFLSGAVFAPFLGSAVDKFGRKRSCIVYCILEIVINVMEHSTNFTVLLMGRILGGISTNLLFSAFESWMTTEHRRKGFPEEWLSRTYSQCSIVNGSMAIVAGIVAQVLEDYLGHIGPFQGAVALTVLALVLVMGWEENYGEENAGDHDSSSMMKQFMEGWRLTASDSRVWRIGLTQALSEGAMYTFVFMVSPTRTCFLS
jgi:MFS family permease